MNPVLEFLNSHGYQVSVYNLSIICLVLSFGVIVVALAYYGRGKETIPNNPEAERWTMLFATWRDSLVITLLYVSEGLMWRAADFQGLSQKIPESLLTYVPFVQPIAGLVLYVLIFTVAALRIIALTTWLHRARQA